MTTTERRVGYKSPPINDPARYGHLSATDLKVLYFLTDLAEKQETRTVTVRSKDIQEALGIPKRRVFQALKRLEDHKYLIVNRNFDEYGARRPSSYTIVSPNLDRHNKIAQAAAVAGIPVERMIEYVWWLNFHRDKLPYEANLTVGVVAQHAHCPASEAEQLVNGLIKSGILTTDGEVKL